MISYKYIITTFSNFCRQNRRKEAAAVAEQLERVNKAPSACRRRSSRPKCYEISVVGENDMIGIKLCLKSIKCIYRHMFGVNLIK